jgi:hypothetical protein
MGNVLVNDGNTLGPRHLHRLAKTADWAMKNGFEVCVAATFSPKFPMQRSAMSTMSAAWLTEHYPSLVVNDIQGDEEYNTRGELRKFLTYAESVGSEQIAVASGWWHIRRLQRIFVQEFGKDRALKVKFVELQEDFPIKERFKEIAKRTHMHLPPWVRYRLETAVRATGFDPS